MLAEAAAILVARSIVGYATTQAAGALTIRLKERLGGDPVDNAVAAAVQEADATIQPRHRTAMASLFDETFLRTHGAPVLARLLVPGDDPTGAELAGAWSEHAAGVRDGAPDARIVAAADEFLTVFGAALDRHEALRDLRGFRDQRAIVEATRGLRAWADRWAHNQRDRALISPELRARELGLDRFVGRSWLVEKVDEFLGSRRSGYFVLQGGAGLGKSAFLAWLARERDYPVHFVRLVERDDHTTAALSNLVYQLAERWEIDTSPLPQGDVAPHEFRTLLEAIASARTAMRRTEPVVLVIDGLDEVGRHESPNVLGLPGQLPDGVFFIVSTRPVNVELRVEARTLCALTTTEPDHLDDLRLYVTAACEREGIAAALARDGRADRELIDALMACSHGVWLCAHHILKEIEDGTRDLTNLEDLPRGLWEFYKEHFGRLLDSEPGSAERRELDVLTTLAAAQEPLDRTVLSDLAYVHDPIGLANAIAVHAAFLERDGAEPYRLYHESARRFLSGEASHEMLSAETNLAQRFAQATDTAHRRIADHYLAAWGGLEHGLPRVRDPTGGAYHDGYGLRQLGAHLRAAKRYKQLRALLLMEWSDGSRALSAWYEAHAQAGDHVRYLRDVEHARALAQDNTDAALYAGDVAATLGDEYGYALLTASIRSHSANLPPQIRLALVSTRIWTAARAIRDAQQLTEPRARARALSALAEHLDSAQLADMLGAAHQINDEDERAATLSGLIEHLDGARLRDPLTVVRKIGDDGARAEALATLAKHVDAPQLGDALLIISQMGDEDARAYALGGLADRLNRAQLSAALDIAGEIGDERERARALSALAEHLDAAQLGDAMHAVCQMRGEHECAFALCALAEHLDSAQLGDALQAARQIGNDNARAQCLRALAPHLDGATRREALADALESVRQIGYGMDGEYARAAALGALAEHLDSAQLSEALEAACRIGYEYWRAYALSELAEHLDGPQLKAALGVARRIGEDGARAEALCALAVHVRGAEGRTALGEALDAARRTRAEDGRAIALRRIAEHLDAAQLGEALDIARHIGNDAQRAATLRELAVHLNGGQRRQALGEALDAVKSIREEHWRSEELVTLSAHLDVEQLTDGLEAARRIGDDEARADVLGALAQRLDSAERQQVRSEALDAASRIRDEHARSEAFRALIQHPDAAEHRRAVGEAHDAARRIGDQEAVAGALETLAEHLERADYRQAIDEALGVARRIGDDDGLARTLVALAPHLNATQLPDALEVARRRIGSEHARANALCALAAHVRGADGRTARGEALDAVRGIRDEHVRADALRGLAEHLDETQLGQALDAARQTVDELARARALGALTLHLDGTERQQTIHDALETARAIGDLQARTIALCALAEHLDDAQIGEALETASRIGHEYTRAEALGRLAQYLDATQLADALVTARGIGWEVARARALRALAVHLDRALLTEALDIGRRIGDGLERAEALSALGGRLQGTERQQVMEEALDAACQIGNERARARALSAAAEHLDDTQLTRALIHARRLGDEHSRARAVGAIAVRLDGAERQLAINEALDAAHQIANAHARAYAMRALAATCLAREHAQYSTETVATWRAAIQGQQLRRALVLDASCWALRIVSGLGGPRAISASHEWMRAVSQWWP